MLPGEFANQLKSGFNEQLDGYLTEREAARVYGHGYRFYLGELEYKGYLKRSQFKRRSIPVLRITEKGMEVGHEVLRDPRAVEPFSFRWKESLILELIKILEPLRGKK